MAVRQYIGAKYVPHGWTDWNAQTLYDPLYIAKYNLGWYILKKPLPQAGVLPTNTEYWALIDNWNGQVEEYRKEVAALSDLIKNSDFGQQWINRKVIMITDSYGININSTSVGRMLGIADGGFVYKAQIGALFVKPTDDYPWPTYWETLQSIDLSTQAFSAEDVTDIIICGGYNDCANNYNTIRGGMATFANQVQAAYPKAMIKVIHWAWSNLLTKKEQIYNLSYRAYSEAGNFKNMIYVPGAETILHSLEFLQSDGYHPNEGGALRLQNYVVAALKGSDKVNYDYGQIKAGSIAGVSLQNSFKFGINGLTAFYSIDLRVTFSENLPKNTTTPIASLTSGPLMQSARIFITANAGSSSYKGFLMVNNNQLMINIFDNNYSGDLKDFFIIPTSGCLNAFEC